MSAKEINNTLDFLKKKLSEIYSVDPKPKAKADALKALDDFKEKSPNAAACGLKLVEKTQTSYFRFYGLQLLQHVVKTRWTDMSPNEQKLLKINVMSLISNGTKHITLEKSDIKDGFARIVVEIIKLDWPNEWPNLLTDLDAISKKQEINAEIVLLILWRLAEDVVTLQIDPVPRAAELKRSLVENMKDILSIILGLLEKNVVRFRVMKTDRSQQFVVQPCCTVAITAIYTLSAYISWMGIWHITQDDCKLLETLWVLLDEPDLQLAAAECLLVAIQRMEKLKNNSVISALFGDSSMSYILSASKMSTGEELTEKNKNALKKICQVVCSLGTVLCNITDSGTPSSFGRYLISLLEFTERSTPFLHFPTQNTWTAILKHEVFSRDPKLLAILPNYLSAIMTNLEKIGFNQKNPSEKSAVLGLFTDKDFSANYQNIHEEQREIIKLACKVEPLTCFKMASLCLKYQLYPAAGAAKGEKLKFLNSASSTSLEQWQSKAFFIEIVMSEVFKLLRKEAVPVKETIELIKIAVHFEPKHPSILPYVNTAVASLLNVFNAENEPSIEFLIQMFEMIEFIKTPTLQSVKDVKSNAFACIIKMWQEKANIFLPHFPTLFNHVKHLLSDELLLTAAEKSFLTKGLIQLSNHFVNYQLQRTFLEELLAPVAALWLSEVMHGLLSDPETFIAYIGADPAVVAKNSENPTALYRSRISYCVSSILEVLRCTQRPASQMEAVAGRFLTGYMPNGEHIYRNPCMDLVLALLNNVFILIRTLHILHLPEVINSVGGMFEDVLKRLEVDKIPDPDPQKSLMEIYNAPVYKTEVEKIQAFFCTLYIESFSILGHAAQSFKENFYQVDDLVNQLLNSALINLEHLPTHRLHTMLNILFYQKHQLVQFSLTL
ncbi:exportin-5-like [Ambystoma mexicanum]|uniref:exportin-5-like n=1 Tax=Ambystoma mexicanum TaxID=8296 RepID=UPI0037E7612D